MVERRQSSRLDTRLNVSYKVLSTDAIGKALTKNLSAAGVRFIAEQRLETGQELEMAIHFPDADPVIARGKVIWRVWRPFTNPAVQGVTSDIGVKFIQIAPKDRERILQYVKLNML